MNRRQTPKAKAKRKRSASRKKSVRRLRFPASPELVKKFQQFEREAQAYWANSEGLAQARATLDRMLAIRDGLIPPPWTTKRRQEDGPQVRLAKRLMGTKFPGGEWHKMGPRAVRHACEELAEAWSVKLPGADSFARAMGRRKADPQR
jgi:hypothetical protein